MFFYIIENIIEKVLRICTVLSGSFEDMDIFSEFQLSSDGGGELFVPIADRFLIPGAQQFIIVLYFFLLYKRYRV